MKFETDDRPTAEDIQNYSYDCKSSPFYNAPFLTLGQRVRAKFRIWDLPGRYPDWGGISAEKGMEGVVVHVEDGLWPTVRFASGYATCVTDFEVEPI